MIVCVIDYEWYVLCVVCDDTIDMYCVEHTIIDLLMLMIVLMYDEICNCCVIVM